MIDKLTTAKMIGNIGNSIAEGREPSDAVAEHAPMLDGDHAAKAIEVTAQTVDALASHFGGDKAKMASSLNAIAVVLGTTEGATIDLGRLEGIKKGIAEGLVPASTTIRAGDVRREFTLDELTTSGLPRAGLFDVNYDTRDMAGSMLRRRERLDAHPSLAIGPKVVSSGTLEIKGGQIVDMKIDPRGE